MTQTLNEFIEMIKKSWTYNKMTKYEQDRCIKTLNNNSTINSLKSISRFKNSRDYAWKILQAIYEGYLQGIGYTDFNWREKGEI